MAALAEAARADPRLAAAQEAGDGQVTQFLAGVPVLLERYRTAPPVARAVIDAAVDARMLGHGPALPHALLEAAAPGYLTDQQWEEDAGEDWLERALAYTAAPCRGVPGPLTWIRPRPGQPAPSQPCYRLADYLEQTGHASRQAGSAPAALWDALLAHARREDLPRLAARARFRGLYRYAFQLNVAAAEAGHISAPLAAAGVLSQAGRTEEAIYFYVRAAETYPRTAEVYQREAEADNSILRESARETVAFMLEQAGRTEEAITWLQAEDTSALGPPMLHKAARTDYRYGDITESSEAAELLRKAGRDEEAITFYQRAAEAYQRAADVGDTRALGVVVRILAEAGRTEEAITFYQRAAEADDTRALRVVVRILAEAGRAEEAFTLLRPRAEAGDTRVLGEAAWMLQTAARTEEAITFYQRAAEAYQREAGPATPAP